MKKETVYNLPKTKVLLSIIIPVYNSENHLLRTLDALSTQIENNNYSDIMLVILNDASTDSSEKIIDCYINKPFVISYKFESRVSTGQVRNIGLDLANRISSDYIALCDSDDIMQIKVARNMAIKLKQEECPLGIAYLQNTDYSDANKIISEKKGIFGNRKSGLNYIGIDIPISEVFMMTNAGGCNKVYDLSFLNKWNIKFADTVYAEDASFVYKILSSIHSVYLFNEVIYNYSHPDTNPNSNDKKSCNTWRELFQAMDEVWEHIEKTKNIEKIQIYESFLSCVIGHIRYAQSKMKTSEESTYVGNVGFEWLSNKQRELEKIVRGINLH